MKLTDITKASLVEIIKTDGLFTKRDEIAIEMLTEEEANDLLWIFSHDPETFDDRIRYNTEKFYKNGESYPCGGSCEPYDLQNNR